MKLNRHAGLAVLALSAGLLSRPALPCTALKLDTPEGPVVGKNLDWDTGRGALILNKRGVEKVAVTIAKGDLPARWVSRFASFTFNQAGSEFPYGGMNERGLVVEMLWLDSTVTPPASAPGEPINESQWIQLQLDTSANVEEAIARARTLRVERVYAPIHYFACDASGACATFEYVSGELVVHAGAALPLPLLTNNTYEESLASLPQFRPFGGALGVPQGQLSAERFVRMASMMREYDGRSDGESFALAALARARMDVTQWSVAYHPALRSLSFVTARNPVARRIGFTGLDLSCASGALGVGLDQADPRAGLKKFGWARNARLALGNAFVPAKLRALLSIYPSRGTKCVSP
jgi:choloylglycine hydrolase